MPTTSQSVAVYLFVGLILAFIYESRHPTPSALRLGMRTTSWPIAISLAP